MYAQAVRPHATGCEIEVRAQPGAKRTAFAGEWNGLPKFAVAAPPEDGRANEALAELLAATLGLRKGQVELVRGATSRLKVFRVPMAPAAALERLRQAAG